MTTRMLIDARHREETRVAVTKGNRIEEFDFESAEHKQLKGNIYLAKVTRVEPSLQAAFVDYGGNRHGFLAFSEIHPDYYQIPKEDREALLREEAEHAAEEAALRAELDAEDDEDHDGEDHDDHADDHHDDEDGEGAPRPKKSTVNDDQVEALRQRRQNLRRRYKIQDVIHRRQVLLVQIVKEERGNKGAALTTYLSLAGRYCVLMPNTARGGGISRKITNANDRKRLKAIAGELDVPQGMGVILRTAGAARTKAEVKRDFEYLLRLWENVRSLTLSSSAPCLVYEEGSLIKRSIRDLYDKDTGEIMVQGEAGYREAKDFMRMLMPSHAKNVKPYTEDQAIFSRSGVEAQLDRLLTPQVTLKSGGYLVINQTEALVSIDVNSGRSTREHSIEDTALQTNLEAASEVARQLRLRDLAGLIVIDFIDMEEKRNNRAVEKRLKEALKNDRARIQVGRISHFGLMEMSRQRIRASVMESTMEVCPHCQGLGHVRSHASIALHVFRAIEEHVSRHSRHDAVVKCPSEIALDILNHKRAGLLDLEQRYGVKISIEVDLALPGQSFNIEKGDPATGTPSGPRPASPGYMDIDEDEDDAAFAEDNSGEDDANEDNRSEDNRGEDGRGEDSDDDRGKRRRRRRRRRGKRGGDDERGAGDNTSNNDASDDDTSDDGDDDSAPQASDDDEEGGGERRKRRRGKRGGRKNRRSSEASDDADAGSDDDDDSSDTDDDSSDDAVAEASVDEAAQAESPAPEDDAEEEVAETVTAEASAEQAEEPADTSTEETSAEEEAEEPNARRRNTRRPRGVKAETAAERTGETTSPSTSDAAEPEATEAGDEAEGESGGKRKKGWWSKGGGFF